MRFAKSAGRHGIGRERARYVVERCIDPVYSAEPGDEDLVIFLGPDANGVPLEIGAVELADGDLLAIHVMRLRRKHLDSYRRVTRWDEA